MSVHIGAKKGEISDFVLLPGDPLRAKYIAENMLKNTICYNEVRGMYGFTGEYRGRTVSIQGTGMGIPSAMIYINELIEQYDVKKLVRIGTCGSIQPHLKLKDVILAMSASTDSNINKLRFSGADYAPTASFELLQKAFDISKDLNMNTKVGNVLTSDTFYSDEQDSWKKWAQFGVLALEMETAGLYTLAAKYGVDALAIMTISDSIVTGEQTTSEERQKTFNNMVELALRLSI